MSAARLSRILLASAAALALAVSAQAANQQYVGSLVIESFGNDVVGGTLASEFFSIFAMPQGLQCNPLHPRCPSASTPVTLTNMGAKVFNPLGESCVPIGYFGATTRPAKGATTGSVHYRNPGFFTPSGLPKATRCTAFSTVSAATLCPFPRTTLDPDCGYATVPLTTHSPKRGPVMKGAPLTGEQIVTLFGTGPAGFAVKAAPTSPVKVPGPTGFGLRRTTFGEFNAIFPYLYSYTYATLRNDAGSFFAGGGPGSFNVKYSQGANTVAQAKVTAGPNKFGGVMRLLGQLTTRVCYFRNGGCSLGGADWLYDAIGAKAATVGGVVTQGFVTTKTEMYYHTNLMQTNTLFISGSRFPWTTGTVSLTARYRGPHPTVEVRKGYDNRTPLGKGTIQLVTPLLTRWLLPGSNFETGGIGIMRLQFVPEPGRLLLLVGGLATLVLLYRMRAR